MTIQTPDWVKHAIFYQIFPDRFARSEQMQHPRGIQFKPWGSPPEAQGFQGGDLYGVVDNLDYLQQLGITALYLNPIFSSASNHRYHTFDYYQVDPLLGGNEALRLLLDQAHAREIKVILDGVFNHASRGFWPFHHVLETGGNSPYIDWFLIHDWPLRPYSSDKDNPANYAAWWDLPALPKLNTANPGVRDLIMDVARYWIEFGIDGWRLDVPTDIDDDSFWQAFRQVVKTANPEAYICGEIWHAAQRWLQGDQFDAVMNYLFTDIALSYFGANTLKIDNKPNALALVPLDTATFAKRVEAMHALYDWEINQVQLNLLDSHDMARALWIMGDDISALRLCVLFQMTMPGAPCIYYGDEIGLSAGTDPFCREAFPWHDKSQWNTNLLAFYQQAIALRRAYPVLCTGHFTPIQATDEVYAFTRDNSETIALIIFNRATNPIEVTLSLPTDLKPDTLTPVWLNQPSTTQIKQSITATIAARDAIVLIGEKA